MIPKTASQQSPPTCPYLGTEAGNSRLGEAVEYPSFENRCWTTTRPIPLLLTDQATLCLCNGYLHCPRFLAARAARQGQEHPATVPPPADSDAITSAIKELEADVQAATIAQTKSRRRWGWIGAGLIFVSSILCGGLFAAYVGWQMVRSDTVATSPGEVNTLAASPAQAQTSQQPQTYLIVTATSEPQAAVAQAPSQANPQTVITTQGGPTPIYPRAVQPTPVPVGAVSQQPPPSLSEIAQETNATASLPASVAQAPASEAAPTLNFDLQIPTRRPTPMLDIPTSTPAADAAVETPNPQPTATPVPIYGTPSVIFYVDEDVIEPDECTTVFWRVENVKAVYYENYGVNGAGQQEECVSDDHGDYNLMVVMPNGATQFYTVTVDVIAPTNTPAPTPTKVDEPEPTATWTPNVPTDTPTPTILYGVRLEAGGDTAIDCERGSTCEVDFYASNTGSAIDHITVRFTEASSWPHYLCRLDGVCSESQMTLADMGFTASGVVRLRVTIPEDASSETLRYKVQAMSDKSGGSATSDSITVEVTAVDPASEQSTEEGPKESTE